jgi:secondary thiamine-phosphate synthase enzyme
MDSTLLEIHTGDRAITDLTDRASGWSEGRGDGLLHLFAPHATAGLALIELGAGSDDDLVLALERWLPRDEAYRHRHGSPGHGRDHVLPAIISPSLTVPVLGGRLALGTWQSIVLVDPNADNPTRQVRLSFLAS